MTIRFRDGPTDKTDSACRGLNRAFSHPEFTVAETVAGRKKRISQAKDASEEKGDRVWSMAVQDGWLQQAVCSGGRSQATPADD